MELSRHIEILLLDSDCVIVPGLGGFVAHCQPAEFDDAAGLLYPPKRTIGFNVQLRMNDSRLATAYMEAYDISFPEAERRVANEVEEIKRTLNVEGSYTFHNIGRLCMSADGRHEFTPDEAGILTPSLYALPPLAISELERKAPTRIMRAHRARHLRQFAAAASALLLFMLPSVPAGVGSGNVTQCSVVSMPGLEAFAKKYHMSAGTDDYLTYLTTPAAETPKAEADTAKTEVAEADTVKAAFSIVLASKVSRGGAEAYIKRLAKRGYAEAEMTERGGVRRVVYGKYDSQGEAQDTLRRMRAESREFAEAWVAEI